MSRSKNIGIIIFVGVTVLSVLIVFHTSILCIIMSKLVKSYLFDKTNIIFVGPKKFYFSNGGDLGFNAVLVQLEDGAYIRVYDGKFKINLNLRHFKNIINSIFLKEVEIIKDDKVCLLRNVQVHFKANYRYISCVVTIPKIDHNFNLNMNVYVKEVLQKKPSMPNRLRVDKILNYVFNALEQIQDYKLVYNGELTIDIEIDRFPLIYLTMYGKFANLQIGNMQLHNGNWFIEGDLNLPYWTFRIIMDIDYIIEKDFQFCNSYMDLTIKGENQHITILNCVAQLSNILWSDRKVENCVFFINSNIQYSDWHFKWNFQFKLQDLISYTFKGDGYGIINLDNLKDCSLSGHIQMSSFDHSYLISSDIMLTFSWPSLLVEYGGMIDFMKRVDLNAAFQVRLPKNIELNGNVEWNGSYLKLVPFLIISDDMFISISGLILHDREHIKGRNLVEIDMGAKYLNRFVSKFINQLPQTLEFKDRCRGVFEIDYDLENNDLLTMSMLDLNLVKKLINLVTLRGYMQVNKINFQNAIVEMIQANLVFKDGIVEISDGIIVGNELVGSFGYKMDIKDKRFNWAIYNAYVGSPYILSIIYEELAPYLSHFEFLDKVNIKGVIWGKYTSPNDTGLALEIESKEILYKGVKVGTIKTGLIYSNYELWNVEPLISFDEGYSKATTIGVCLTNTKVYINKLEACIRWEDLSQVFREYFNIFRVVSLYGQLRGVINGELALRSQDGNILKGYIYTSNVQINGIEFYNGNLNLIIDDNELCLSNIITEVYGGKLRGYIKLTGATNGEMQFNFEEIDLSKLASYFSGSTTVKGKVDGHITLLVFDLKNYYAWTGDCDIHIKEGLLWDIPLFSVISDIINILLPGFGRNKATALTGKITFKEGELTTQDLKIYAPPVTVILKGKSTFTGELGLIGYVEILRTIPLLGSILNIALVPVSKALEFEVTGTIKNPQIGFLYIPPPLMKLVSPLKWLYR